MKVVVFSLLLLLLLAGFLRKPCKRERKFKVSAKTLSETESEHASIPPRGWNSYDSFCWTISEKEFLQSAEIVSNQLRDHGYEIWDLNVNGTLLNSHSGKCAKVNPSKVTLNSNGNGIRSWIATGRQGEIYVAFFNLNPTTTTISAKVSDVRKALPGINMVEGSCEYREVWSGEEIGETKEWITMAVESHGCALFVLTCDQPSVI